MKEDNIQPHESTFTAILTSLSHATMLKEGESMFQEMKEMNIPMNMIHHNCMVDVMARSGRVEEALEYIEKNIPSPDIITWKSLLAGLCLNLINLHMIQLLA